MATDVYQPCPCRSGKKYKFCCHPVADEMAKVYQAIQNGQNRSALQILEKLEQGPTLYPQVAIELGNLLIQDGDYASAKTTLQKLLTQEPNHPLGAALFGLATLMADGIDRARPAIYRAFLHGGAAGADVTSEIAMFLATYSLLNRQFLATREHLALAMRLAPEAKRQDIFLKLLQFDSDRRIPYPFRSVHPLVDCKLSGEFEKTYRRARRFCETGCFSEAHKAFLSLAEQHTDPVAAAPLWQNTGYALAWDGQNEAAADALHKAAKLSLDFAAAVECETLAQLIDQVESKDRIAVKTVWYPVESVSRLLSVLDDQRQLKKAPDIDEDDNVSAPAAQYYIADRPVDPYAADKTYTLDELPVTVARLLVYDRDDRQQKPSRVFLTGYEGEQWDAGFKILESIAGTGIDFKNAQPQHEDDVVEHPREMLFLEREWVVPPGIPGKFVLELNREQTRRIIEDKWPNTPLAALGGATPNDVAGDETFRVPLTAAVYAFDANADAHRMHLPIDEVARRLKVNLLPPLEVTEQTPLQAITSLGLLRLPLEKLSDKQLSYALNRVLLVHHGRLLYETFQIVHQRLECIKGVDLNRFYTTMLELSRERFATDERLSWIEKGKEHAKTVDKPFERTLEWTLRELAVRAEDPDDPALDNLLTHVWDYYGSKIPELRQHLAQMAKMLNLRAPWNRGGQFATGESASHSGLWSPESSPSSAEKSNLWIPGQD